jgi:cytochrome c peroxidase
MMNKRFLVFAAVFILLMSCNKDILNRFTGFRQPANFPAPVYRMNDNPITEDGFILGRKLFYEPRLSRNNTISCGSCHIQSSAFTQHGHDVSHGIDDRLGSRNSPPIMNLAWSPDFFWDGGVFDLDLQPIAPITNHEEMDETVENVLNKLRQHPQYPSLFKKAFGSTEITTARMMKALSQFMLLCISSQSKYDSVKNGTGKFTAEEQQGYTLFQQKCSNCHKEPLFTDHSFRNNGIAIGPNNDKGRYLVTLNDADRYKFKVPSLRNLEFTAPYMHDGRFLTLDAVLDHYTSGVQSTPNLDPLLSNGIPLSSTEREQLRAFLKTLSDRNFLNNRLLSEQ